MSVPDTARLDAVELAGLVRRREVTARELTDAALARLDRVDPALHAVVARLDDQARAQADRVPTTGPLAGVPFVLKDLLSSATGTPLTSGSRLRRGNVCDHDSELVRRYREAGLVFLARSASPELGLQPVTEPEAYGPVGTPWDPARAAGGSSGGSSALVAAGVVPIANGGDGGGSLRVPASCCGVFGLKPTRARTPAGPDVGEHWHGLAQEHVLSRSVRDSAAALDATCAPEDGAPYAAPPRERPYLDEVGREPGRLRVAWTATPFLPSKVQPEAIAAVQDAARLCASLGHDVVEAAPVIDPAAFARALITVIASETASSVVLHERAIGRRRRPGELEVTTELVAMYGRAVTGEELCTALHELRMLGRLMATFHRTYDVLLTPAVAAPPPLHHALRSTGAQALAERVLARSRARAVLRLPGVLDTLAASVYDFIPWTPLANVTGAPSMSVPLYWTPAGLPLGAMFTARFGDEATLFRLAAQLEAARPWKDRRPRVHAFA